MFLGVLYVSPWKKDEFNHDYAEQKYILSNSIKKILWDQN